MDDSWGATEITFLENAFHQRAIRADRYEVANGNTPSAGSVSEETQAELDEFIENTNLIISALGISAFQPKATAGKSSAGHSSATTPNQQAKEEEPTFELTVPRHGVQGLGQRTAEGFWCWQVRLSGKSFCPAPREVSTQPGTAMRTRFKTARCSQISNSQAHRQLLRFSSAVLRMGEGFGTSKRSQPSRWRIGRTAKATRQTTRQRSPKPPNPPAAAPSAHRPW